jgi:spermidine/putrescine transport system permease protein
LFFGAVVVLVSLLLFNYRVIRRYRKAEKRGADE